MPEQHTFVIKGNRVRGVYHEAVDLRRVGTMKIEKAGSVEFDNEQQGWRVKFPDGTELCTCGIDGADWHIISPAGDYTRAIRLFHTYADAVRAEEQYVEQHVLAVPR